MKDTPCRYHCDRGLQMEPVPHPCTSCNGTGIDGNPCWLMLILALAFLGVLALLAYVIFG